MTVKEVKLKELPELDDDFAIDAGFDDLDELREDIRARLLEADAGARRGRVPRGRARRGRRAARRCRVTPELVKARAREMWERMLHSLSHRGISREAYLQITGREEEEILAEHGARRRAGAAPRGRAHGDRRRRGDRARPSEELLEALAPTAEREGVEPAEAARGPARRAGAWRSCARTSPRAQAIELIAERASRSRVAQAQAREQLWTPGQDAERHEAGAGAPARAPGKLWTPTDQRSAS